MLKSGTAAKALRAAFPHTLPIMAGYLFLGVSYGIYATSAGLSPLWPMSTALAVYGGTMEFVSRDVLLGAFNLGATFLLTIMVQARHIFYGLSMLEIYRDMDWKKYYLIFGLSDETFSVTVSTLPPAGIDRGWFYFFITLLDQMYWFIGVTVGALGGAVMRLQVQGLDFVMTALLTVVFLNSWMKEKDHTPSLIGLGVPILMLILLGSGNFMIPAMAGILLLLTALRPRLEGRVGAK